MAGIYIHIPFCKQACHYCNFHFSTSLKTKEQFIQALLQEIDLRQAYLKAQTIDTLYLGGGTPSLLHKEELTAILRQLKQYFSFSSNFEFTLEANPDDISETLLEDWQHVGINRLSIGIQSFRDEDLQWMNRAHTAKEARQAIEWSQAAGFNNITIDLIYGTPGLNNVAWKDNLQQAFDLNVPHLSAYNLTVEPNTALANFVNKGKAQAPGEGQSAEQFEILMHETANAGFEHYEISNFAQPGYYSKHNSSYWQGKHYLGLGPSAHSYNGTARQWNIANNMQYIKALEAGKLPQEEEVLSPTDQYNELLLTSLRTHWGLDLNQVEHQFGVNTKNTLAKQLQPFIAKGWIEQVDTTVRLTHEGKLLADHITSELFES